ncbi:MAG: PASTA domain-containing protein [Endomicrobium sp.]|jgi:serine/threonine-protein kinase|nr:PASTA domain-containing protein [Endomicrobium sp.]
MKTIIKLFVILLVLAGACYYSFNMIMTAFIHSEEEIVLPDVKGKSVVEALNELSSMGLSLRKEGEEFNQTLAPGVVLRQSPPAGMNVRKGKTIKVTISQGGEMIYVPDLVGQTVRAADIMLKSSSLMIGEISRKYSVVAEKGVVISQDPTSSSSVEKDAVINLVVSDGVPPEGIVLMPDWINKPAAIAKEWAQSQSLSIDIKTEQNSSVLADTVLKQSPAPDANLSKNDKIVLYVSEIPKDKVGQIIFNYTVPGAKGNKRLQFVLADDKGEKIIFNAVKKPSEKISIPVEPDGQAVIKVYINKKFIEDVKIN